jgi:hypothetical protein
MIALQRVGRDDLDQSLLAQHVDDAERDVDRNACLIDQVVEIAASAGVFGVGRSLR